MSKDLRSRRSFCLVVVLCAGVGVRCESLRVGKEMGVVLQKGGFWYNV